MLLPKSSLKETEDCVDANHTGLLRSVFQSGVGAEGRSLTRDAGSVPWNPSRYSEFYVGADVALIQPAICPLLAGLSRNSLKLPVNTWPPKFID